MEDIKVEFDETSVCHGCLSVNRKLSALGDYYEIFYYILGNISDLDHPNVVLCWECIAILKKLKSFQKQIRSVRELLADVNFPWKYQNDVYSLSALQTTKKDDLSIDGNFIEVCIPQTTEIKEESLELIPNISTKEEECIESEVDHVDSDESTNIDESLMVEKNELIKMELESEVQDADLEESTMTDKSLEVEKNKRIKKELESEVEDGDSEESTIDKSLKIEKPKRFKKKQYPHSLKVYKEHAIVTKLDDIKMDSSKYYVQVHLSEKEMEELAENRDRKKFSSNKLLKCMECGLGYRRVTDLNMHKQFNHCTYDQPVKCLQCNKTQPTLQDMVKHWNTHMTMIRCLLCHEICRDKGSLTKHRRLAHSTLYNCKYCKLKFSTLRDFGLHYKDEHKWKYCDYCNRKFSQKTTLAGHIRRKHEPDIFNCEQCDATFKAFRQLQYHVTVRHKPPKSAELAYCVSCDLQFKTTALYQRHLSYSVKHAAEKGRKTKNPPVKCPECPNVYARRQYMRNHYNYVHLKKTKYYCSMCDRYFLNRTHFVAHMKYDHEGAEKNKNKICSVCEKGFSENRLLLNHMRTHTGERPFQCPQCDKCFTQKYPMQLHLKNVHGKRKNR